MRRAIRGQNLDRAGLTARHMNVLNALSEPRDTQELVQTLGWDTTEVRQVLHAFELAELVERRSHAIAGKFVVYEPNAHHAQSLRNSLEESDNRYSGKVVRDKLALQLVLKRMIPHTLVFAGDDEDAYALIRKTLENHPSASQIKFIVVTDDRSQSANLNKRFGFTIEETLTYPYTAEKLFAAMDRLLAEGSEHVQDEPAGVGAVEQLEFATMGASL